MATKHDDPSRSSPEWPPHPDRLFSALVAAASEATETRPSELVPGAEAALTWLCGQGSPELSAAKAHVRTAPDVHMPTNPHPDEIPRGNLSTGDEQTQAKKRRAVLGLLPMHRKKAALPIPVVVPEEPVVYFIWPRVDPETSSREVETLRAVCRRVTCLGRSRSLVRATVVDEAPPPTHIPDPVGQVQLRVPGRLRLGYLVEKYKRDGGKPEPCPLQHYRRADDESQAPEQLRSVFEGFWVFQPERGDPRLPVVSILTVTKTLRRALIACIEEHQRRRGIEPRVPDVVHGHGRYPHCAYISLPFVHPTLRYADGSIKGVALLLPRGIEDEALVAIAGGLDLLQQNGLSIPGVGTWHVKEVEADDPPNATLDPATWTEAARVWATATPMVFGHFPKPSKGGEPQVILDSLRMIDVEPDRVVEIAVGHHSPLQGTLPSWDFKARQIGRERGEAPPWGRHVTVRFDRAVRGPIVLGRMRYFGLGLMRPLGG
jgi:CRISPR-associated protein Csb2